MWDGLTRLKEGGLNFAELLLRQRYVKIALQDILHVFAESEVKRKTMKDDTGIEMGSESMF